MMLEILVSKSKQEQITKSQITCSIQMIDMEYILQVQTILLKITLLLIMEAIILHLNKRF